MSSPAESSRRQSRQREAVFEVVAATRTHPTADWIHQRVRERLPDVSLGTVYRNLQVLAEQGRLRAIESWGKATRYDADVTDHYHFVCDGCAAILDLEKPRGVDRRIAALLSRREFLLRGHRLEFRGLCPSCRKQKNAAFPDRDPRKERSKENHGQARKHEDTRKPEARVRR